MGATEFIFELEAPKTKIKDVFDRTYRYCGNLLCQEDDHIVFKNAYALKPSNYQLLINSTKWTSTVNCYESSYMIWLFKLIIFDVKVVIKPDFVFIQLSSIQSSFCQLNAINDKIRQQFNATVR